MRAAVFDLDKTIIVKPSIVALGPELHARGLIHRGTLIRAVFGQFMFSQYGADQSKMEKFRRSVLKMVKGWDRDEVREIVRSTLTEILEPLIYKEAADLIVHHQQLGDEVWIVSSSPEEVVEPFADLLHINGVIASRAEVDSNNKYTGELEFYAQGPSKAVAIKELAATRGIDLETSSAYSDSETDVAMLEIVGHPFAVNPDRTLSRIAHERSWPILQFTQPVTVRDGRASRTPYVLGVVVVGTLALFGRLSLRRRA